MQLILILNLEHVLHFEGSGGSILGVIFLFIGFPFGLGLAVALLLIKRWVVGVLFLTLSLATFYVGVKAANEVQPIPAPETSR
jgi:membrane protein implicated in regulation of membrane protease activity